MTYLIHRIKNGAGFSDDGEYMHDSGFEVLPAKGTLSIFGEPYRIASFRETHVCPVCGAHRKPRYFPEYPTTQIEGVEWFENEHIDSVDSGAYCGSCGFRYAC